MRNYAPVRWTKGSNGRNFTESKSKMKIKSNKKSAIKKTVVKKCAKCATKKTATTPKAAIKNVVLTIHAEKGKAVYVAGEFNKWDPTAKKMVFKNGVYSATLKLAAGTYQYKFVIDGTWCADPENVNAVPNTHGTFNSVLTVK